MGSSLRVTQAVLLGAFILMVQTPVLAEHCRTHSTSTTDVEKGTVVVELNARGLPEMRYFFADACQLDWCVYSFGFYYESNGIPGLQRNDPGADDTCHGLIQNDLFAF